MNYPNICIKCGDGTFYPQICLDCQDEIYYANLESKKGLRHLRSVGGK